MSFDFRSYNSAVEDLLGAAAWAELGEEEPLDELVERVREKHQELADAGALPAVVFIQAVARVTDRAALEAHLRETDRLSEPVEGTKTTEAGLARDALFSPVEYKRDEEPPVWVGGISRHSVTEDGGLLVEGPVQVDAVGLRRNRAISDLARLVASTISEFAEETPGLELVEVNAERLG
jgi:hypothetical protein